MTADPFDFVRNNQSASDTFQPILTDAQIAEIRDRLETVGEEKAVQLVGEIQELIDDPALPAVQTAVSIAAKVLAIL